MSTVTDATEQLQKARMEWTDFHDTFKDELKWTPEQISFLRAAFISFRMKGAGRLSDWPPKTPRVTMKNQNQTSEVAKNHAETWFLALQHNPTVDNLADVIQSAIDAATAEVKKEGLGSETHAMMDVQREETGKDSSKFEPYHVESNMEQECSSCHAGRTFDVIGPDGVALGTSYYDLEAAEGMADELTQAFNRGRDVP